MLWIIWLLESDTASTPCFNSDMPEVMLAVFFSMRSKYPAAEVMYSLWCLLLSNSSVTESVTEEMDCRDVLNQLIDVSRSTIGLTGKAGNLLGNNGKTASGFTGAVLPQYWH